MSVSAKVEARNYVTEEVEEELYAGSDAIAASSTTPVKVASGKVSGGYDAVAIGVACSQEADCGVWLKIATKQHYPNGLNTAGLGGLTEETLLLVKVPEGKEWELGFTNTSGAPITMAWRFRLRLFKKGVS